MAACVDGRHFVLQAGDEGVVPPGAVHTWCNAGETPLVVDVELRPALRFEQLLREAFSMHRAQIFADLTPVYA